MNAGLKAILTSTFDAVKIAIDLAAKAGTAVELGHLIGLGESLPSVIASAGGLNTEIAALLKGAAEQQDLLAYVAGQFGTLTTDSKAANIFAAVMKLLTDLPPIITDTEALIAACEGK